MDTSTLLLLYKSLILPIFDFADVIYHSLKQADAVAFQYLQNAACRATLKTDHYAHISDMHEELNIINSQILSHDELTKTNQKCNFHLGATSLKQ